MRTVFLFVVCLTACDRSPSDPSAIPHGVWGGDHVTLTVSDTGSHLEFDCAHGDIPGGLTAKEGTIAAQGTFTREHGGPIRTDDPADIHPALYSGTITGSTMHLGARLTDSGDVVGSFVLVEGTAGRVTKCL